MSEGAENKLPERTALHDPKRAKESIKRAQEKGEWPTLETDYKGEPVPPQTEKVFKKEERTDALSSFSGKETIPPEIKKELTEETKRIHTMAMEGEEKKTGLPKVKPFVEGGAKTPLPSPQTPQSPEPIVAKGGAEPLRRILKAEEENQEMRKGPTEEEVQERIRKRQAKVPEEAKGYIPPSQQPRDVRRQAGVPIPTPRPEQQPQPEKKGFFAKLFGKRE